MFCFNLKMPVNKNGTISVEQIKRDRPKLKWFVVVVKGSNCFILPINLANELNQPCVY